MKKEKQPKINLESAVTPVFDDPKTPEEMVNKYGTYEIQPTAETHKAFPQIAQGYPKSKKHK